MLADPQLRQTVQCIRCGACMNHCPVYTRIGGHAYGYVYPGPIGSILTPQLEGLDKAGVLATASSLCHACDEVCPVKIPITEIMRRLRNESYSAESQSDGVKGQGYKKNKLESLVWKGWETMNTVPFINTMGTKMLSLIGAKMPKIGPLKAWMSVRTKPKFAKQSLHVMVKKRGLGDE